MRVSDWRHVTKLDPDKRLGRDEIERVCRSGTDAVVIGGTQRVTEEKTRDLLGTVTDILPDGSGVDVAVEPSNPWNVVQEDNYLLVPTVLNAGRTDWVVGTHKDWLSENPGEVDWSLSVTEGYIVLNPESAVAALTEARCDIGPDDAAGYARVADRVLGVDVVYVEYSGSFGDTETVEEVAGAVDEARVFYGGGVDTERKAREVGGIADTVVVGDAVYDEGVEAVEDTVDGVEEATE